MRKRRLAGNCGPRTLHCSPRTACVRRRRSHHIYHEGCTGCTRSRAAVSTSRTRRPARDGLNAARFKGTYATAAAGAPAAALLAEAPSPPTQTPGRAELLLEDFNTTARPLREFDPQTFDQRLCLYDGFAKNVTRVLLYVGNESPVDEYVNNTGLMWEYASTRPGTLLVWAEHRYEARSTPDTKGLRACLSYCTVEQALADYAVVVQKLRSIYGKCRSSPIGGSYGGMLAAWFRLKYPASVQGAIAASAPIWGLPLTRPPPERRRHRRSAGLRQGRRLGTLRPEFARRVSFDE